VALDLRPVQVRLSDEAYDALKLLADIEDKDLGEKARELLTAALLGQVHAIRLLKARLSRATTSDSSRQEDPE
jgi:hypothetical protein